MKKIIIILSLIQYSFALIANDELMSKNVSFYSETVSIQFNPDLYFQAKFRPEIVNTATNKSQLQEFYEKLERKGFLTFLHSLEQAKKNLQLNDWLYYDLMKKSVDEIFKNYTQNYRTVMCWFFMAKSDFDVRLTYQGEKMYLNAFTKDQLFEVPIIRDGNRAFVNLTNLHDKGMAMDKLYVAAFMPNPSGRAISFDLTPLPNLKSAVVQKKIRFETVDNEYEFEVAFDKTLINLMREYPFIAEHKYMEVPISATLSESLIPVFKQILDNKSWKEKLEILAAFTRTGFAYKTDEEVYGKSKPMIAEEIFHYQFSDCEDRSALFYGLVKELLKFPMIIMAYPDHVTVGVATPKPIGPAYSYQNKKYYVCDPTGPEGSYEIGRVPHGYEQQGFEVITAFEGRELLEMNPLPAIEILVYPLAQN